MLAKNASQATAKNRKKAQSPQSEPQATPAPATAGEPTPKMLTAGKLAEMLYYYQAVVRGVYDGDTITVDIDLGMHNWVHGEKVRLLRINAQELKGATHEAGAAARDYLRSLVEGKQIVLETYKDDKEKYGRYLAEVWVADESGHYFNINDRMVQAGQAAYKAY